MDDRTTRENRERLASALAGWRGARPPKQEKQPSTYPIPGHAEPDPVEGDPRERMMERLKTQQRGREFMEQRARRPRRDI